MNIVKMNASGQSARRQPSFSADTYRRSAQKKPVILYGGEHTLFAQRGVALVVSLVLLAAMTIVGVATLSGTRLSEQMASNSQQKSAAFEAAESAIESVINYDDLFAAITSDPNASFDNPDLVPLPDSSSNLGDGYDLTNGGKGIDIEGTLSVQYCGETQPIGTSLDASLDGDALTAVLVDVNGITTIANSSASADHLRRVAFNIPRTGRIGNCKARF